MSIKQEITESIKYWEPRRIIYNIILALIVIYNAIPVAIKQRDFPLIPSILVLFVLAIMANILFCASYPVDIFIKMSEFRDVWIKFRWLLFLTGTALASIFTWFICMGIFGPSGTW